MRPYIYSAFTALSIQGISAMFDIPWQFSLPVGIIITFVVFLLTDLEE